MLTFLNYTVSALSLLVGVAATWLAFWSYGKLRITIFAWLVMTKVAEVTYHFLFVSPGPESTEKAVKHLHYQAERMQVPVEQMYLSFLSFAHLFPQFVILLLGMIAASEVVHLAGRNDPSYQLHGGLRLIYRIRWLLGLMAVLATIAPAAILNHVVTKQVQPAQTEHPADSE
jgi:hypothetical protein